VERAQLDGRIVLVVEDEPLVGLEITETLSACGAHVVTAGRVADAIKAVDRYHISAAVLDINLDGDDCSAVCERLSQLQIPFFFYTGYSAVPDGWADAPMITKPADGSQIVDAVNRLCGLKQHDRESQAADLTVPTR
jgi:DNA-binding response OmpR family regulator